MDTPQVRALRTELQARKDRLVADQRKIESLEKQLPEYVPAGAAVAFSADDEEKEDEENGGEDNEIAAQWDSDDDVYRCPDCHWEVIDGLCQACAREFKWDEEEEDSLPADSLEENSALHEDRTSSCRSTTPLNNVGPSRPLQAYWHRGEEYTILLCRGATRLMIETFNLEFTSKKGIFAWADWELYNQFAGPKMKKGDFWKIQLGRRFDLDEDDLDGSVFIEGLLEDALLFPTRKAWETVEETPGIWITRLIDSQGVVESASDSESEEYDSDTDMDDEHKRYERALENLVADDGPVLLYPGYEMSDDEEEEVVKVEENEQQVTCSGDDDVEMDTDSGWTFEAHVPDQPWGSESELGDEEVDASADGAPVEVDPQTQAVGDDDIDTLDEDSDEADSDFDSDEVLSGDEDIYQHEAALRKIYHGPYVSQ